MTFKRTVQQSKPLQSLLALAGCVILFICYYSNIFGFLSASSSTYTPEEINTLLQNKESHIVALRKTELTAQGLAKPYLDETHFHVKNWDLHGNPLVENNEYIRLTSLVPHSVSNMFSKMPIQAESFEMELTFHIHNNEAKHGLVGDGLAVWFLDRPSEIGDVFGVRNEFNGLGIMMDTYKNGKRGQFPYVNLMLGDGRTHYNKATDGYETRLAGCSAKGLLNPSSKETKMRLVYIKNGYLSIDFNYNGKHEDWENCVTLTDVQMPMIKFLGLSAETGQLYENVDILENKIYALYKPNGGFVESIDELNDLVKEQNEYDQEENNLAGINDQINQQEKKSGGRNRAFKKKLSSQRRKTLKRLKNAEKRIKERERKERLEKYGDPDATLIKRMFGNILWFVKILIYVIIAATLLWFIWIIIRVQKQRRKKKTAGLLD
ncbi:hypothetical protein CORT_0B06160 [Candida orthopsilosis Co 90-125]|uniref:L-type lectin-like domain-containing protein n=1 Tax=Candida orthopsilosis (strain 90-125) TaxID=1136231 RepID=H8WZY0_CANO9|nr:hypothetical protein CORT_0B06160 [Candida orthopsilosis Co 90-125]CCG22325.1 hypothetical protein CORT_0B06160 [Candida orthopsilosis Co 90-125]